MTTEPFRILRESPSTWPAFENVNLPESFEILSLETRGPSHEHGVSGAVERFQAAVSSALSELPCFELLVRSGPVDLSSRMNEYRYQKQGIWQFLDPGLVDGLTESRHDWRVEMGGGRYILFGLSELPMEQLEPAVQISRTNDAVVLASAQRLTEIDLNERLRGAGGDLFVAAAELIPELLFAIRGIGKFDDPSGIDVIGSSDVLGRIAQAISRD